MSKKTKLSDRIRPNSEAAPWVIKEIKEIESEISRLTEALKDISEGLETKGYSLELWPSIMIAKAKAALTKSK